MVYFGGAVKMTYEHFVAVNGLTTKIRGWGAEDGGKLQADLQVQVSCCSLLSTPDLRRRVETKFRKESGDKPGTNVCCPVLSFILSPTHHCRTRHRKKELDPHWPAIRQVSLSRYFAAHR